jgi:hypothetical protein
MGVIIRANKRLMSILFATGNLMATKMVNMAYTTRSSTKLTYVVSGVVCATIGSMFIAKKVSKIIFLLLIKIKSKD